MPAHTPNRGPRRPMLSVPLGLALLLLLFNVAVLQDPPAPATLDYPATRTVEFVEQLHGTPVADPYRWLEDNESDEVRRWASEQNALTRGVLDAIPAREPIAERLAELWDAPRRGAPFTRGGRTFYYYNAGLDPQSVLRVRDVDDDEDASRVLLDPNLIWPDGTRQLAGAHPSPDGRWLAYGVSYGGSDWREWRVRNVETGEDLDHVVRHSKYSRPSWAADSSGFYYTRYPAPHEVDDEAETNRNGEVRFHRLGEANDEPIYARPDHPEALLWGGETSDGRFLLAYASLDNGNRREIWARKRASDDDEEDKFELLIHMHGARGTIVGNDGTTFYMHTNQQASRNRLVAFEYEEPGLWRDIIPQPSLEVLRSVRLFGDTALAFYERGGSQRIVRHCLETGEPLGEVETDERGIASGFNSPRDAELTYFSLSTFTAPPTIHRLDPATGEAREVYRPAGAFEPGEIVVEQVEYVSRDGTAIPMFVLHPHGLVRDGTNPTLLSGYGGFNRSVRPRFSRAEQLWFELGGVVALPALRGGGDHGQRWHEAGRTRKKQNTFDDFIHAAKWLIRENYTSPDKLAIRGASNGGLLVGAVLNQRPGLFGAALPHAGVMDMLRFHRFTIGHTWTSEYGSPDDPEMFHYLLGYSPYHNIRTGVGYPATLITTSSHDDRVVPAHSFKYAARMQERQVGNAPILLRVETHSGHGTGLTMQQRLDNTADWLAFLVDALEINADFD